jgi:hypothetical protein
MYDSLRLSHRGSNASLLLKRLQKSTIATLSSQQHDGYTTVSPHMRKPAKVYELFKAKLRKPSSHGLFHKVRVSSSFWAAAAFQLSRYLIRVHLACVCVVWRLIMHRPAPRGGSYPKPETTITDLFPVVDGTTLICDRCPAGSAYWLPSRSCHWIAFNTASVPTRPAKLPYLPRHVGITSPQRIKASVL